MTPAQTPQTHAGFTYLTVLFLVAFMGIGLAVTGKVWRTAATREKEAELLYVGDQYRRAIERYYLHGAMRYPVALEDLLKDPRYPDVRRYLRKLYLDPITGSGDWGVVKAPDGGIMGVYSRSGDKPLKIAGFNYGDRLFEQSQAYSAWKFVYTPGGAQAPITAPGAAGAAPAAGAASDASLPQAAQQLWNSARPLSGPGTAQPAPSQ
jgi:type II secretory pathway pseudopilin PulG